MENISFFPIKGDLEEKCEASRLATSYRKFPLCECVSHFLGNK